MNKILKTYKYLLALVVFTSCSDITNLFDDSPVEFEKGEKVMFTTNVPNIANVMTRAYTPDTELLRGYSTINDNYTLSIKMFEEGVQDALGTYIYRPVSNETGYDVYGKLAAANEAEAFYWNSNVRKYAFEATAGTETLEVDQTTKEKWLAQDRLHGYAFAPLLNTDDNSAVDNIKAPNYHTNKEWGAMNKAWRDAASAENEMLSTDDYKMIPLFLQHQRSWITLKLKAGNGVNRDDLKFENAQKKVSMSFFNYNNGSDDPTVLDKPYLVRDTVNYVADKMGGVEKGAETTSFNVIVDPHNYTGENATKDKIAAISVAGLKFSFFAANDNKYTTSAEPTDEQRLAMAAYNLEAGKHLTITATLTTDRLVYITAWIEDWTEIATSTICDDYGQNGDPILINSRADLINFLNSETENKSGNVAIVVANTLDLDKNITTTYYQEGDKDIPAGKKPGDVRNSTETPDPWSNYANKTLNATLNMAGAKFTTSSQFLGTIESTGSIVNGTVVLNNTTDVSSVIAETNKGTLERINVIPYGTAKANKGGLVVTNNGTIYQCTSTLPVYGNEGYLGGIAAESKSIDGTLMPVIHGCTVNAPVKGTDGVTAAGGIVGLADGRIINNANEYGITLLQPIAKYKNIIGQKTERTLRASNNSWPTIADNSFEGEGANANANTTARYDNVLDCQEELKELLNQTHNSSDKKYRIAADFTVNSQFWKRSDGTFIGQQHDNVDTKDDICNGNLYCELNGNNKTITLDGTEKVQIPTSESGGKATAYEERTTSAMLLSNITGTVHDLTIYLETPLIATPSVKNPSDKVLTSVDAIAPLAYSVRGEKAKISNIKVKMAETAYVQAALTAGLVCWASHGATIEDCQVKGKIQSWLPNSDHGTSSVDGSDARRYTGGIVGEASIATIKRCTFHSATNTLMEAKATPSGTNIFFGGILGGTAVKDINNVKELPAVSIVDCVSWFETYETQRAINTVKKGTIIGRSLYTDNNTLHNGTVITGDDRCQGNWWKTAYDAVGEKLVGETDETVVGKCSGATPTIDKNY